MCEYEGDEGDVVGGWEEDVDEEKAINRGKLILRRIGKHSP